MIRDHEFNTSWWGKSVGFVHDPAFFSLNSTAQMKLLAPYTWAEFYSQMDQAPPLQSLAEAGFIQIDTQIKFLLNLSKVATPARSDMLEFQFADQKDFNIEVQELASFSHERFHHIPKCTQISTNKRYAKWANWLIHQFPETCMKLFLSNKLQGWFLSYPRKQLGLNLTLAMLSNTSEISGMLLYQQACRAYAERGHRLGGASFSVKNTAVHNIYAALGARFLPPGGNWLWVSPELGKPNND